MSEHKDRGSVIRCRLKQMAKRAEERREFLKYHGAELSEKDRYIRIDGEGYRAVSLNDKTPLCGFAKRGAKNIDTILGHFENNERELREPRRKVPERHIQCWLIKQALKNKCDLKSTILSSDNTVYDELLFALDEVSLGDAKHSPIYRCDVLAVGVDKDGAFPVLIELKSGRKQDELIKQLDKFSKEIERYAVEFAKLLSACTGEEITVPKVRKMVIWPGSRLAREDTPKNYDEAGVDVVEYEWSDRSDINSLRFVGCRYSGCGG
jgi:hypothetical protein